MTANMVPVCNITSNMVSSGEVGSRPISFSAMMTWAELETGSSSANPWTMERMNNCRKVMCLCSEWTSGGRVYVPKKQCILWSFRQRILQGRPAAHRSWNITVCPCLVAHGLVYRNFGTKYCPECLQGSGLVYRAMGFFRHFFHMP